MLKHVTFIALSGDSASHFTTLIAFVPGLGNDVAKLFAQVLHLCDRQGLIGRQMFAIDGVKQPSNASKTKSRIPIKQAGPVRVTPEVEPVGR